MRPYTPIIRPYRDGYMDLVVKKYQDGSVSRTIPVFALQHQYTQRAYEHPPANSSYEKGYVTKQMIQEMMLDQGKRNICLWTNRMLAFVCGQVMDCYLN
ncbi:uncharacterized protein B0P05DRAFT_544096 [Gilbertella persicaria]|uniref:uncharacterized protein n=1 Tax=Gilbertella persicaria TaxID=101096 RepID=UPI00221EB56D|nr:uncharacterized protein B0P05DRAFT_544096 [Gilbertella persicaria]KAI8078088.1 hypothetical protein B0P05DRAFT_544096 [Gilbertella persicaria]